MKVYERPASSPVTGSLLSPEDSRLIPPRSEMDQTRSRAGEPDWATCSAIKGDSFGDHTRIYQGNFKHAELQRDVTSRKKAQFVQIARCQTCKRKSQLHPGDNWLIYSDTRGWRCDGLLLPKREVGPWPFLEWVESVWVLELD